MALTDKAIRALQPQAKSYKRSDEKGLYLLIHPNGSKYWRMRYNFLDREKVLSIGVYPETSLMEAREATLDARKKVSKGIDPSQEKKLTKLMSKHNAANNFRAVAEEWLELQRPSWTARHANYVLKRLKADVFTPIGHRPINEITAPEFLLVLREIERRGATDIAIRIRHTCGQIFRYAVATGRTDRDITADLKGALKTRKRKHYAYLQENELPDFLQKLDTYNGDLQTKLGFKLLILVFVRTGELRGARWNEIDFKNSVWRLPAERMKMRQPHVVPLSKQALNILKSLQSMNSHSEYVFPNRSNPKNFISENTLLYAVYRMGYHKQTTVHGFRATASTILNEKGFRYDVIERQLAHSETNNVRASYNHAQYLPERAHMMQWWADYIDGLNVSNLKAA